MTLLNTKYNNSAFSRYIGSIYGHSALVALHDEAFPFRRGTKFKARYLNPYQSFSAVRNQGQSAWKNIKSVLKDLTHAPLYYALNARLPVGTVILKPINTSNRRTRTSKITKNISGQLQIADYFNLKNCIKKIQQSMDCRDEIMLFHSIENVIIDPSSTYVHGHCMFTTLNSSSWDMLEIEMELIAKQYGYSATIKPLKNAHGHNVVITPSTADNSADYSAIKAFTYYCHKQYRLPVMYGTKAHRHYSAVKKLSDSQLRNIIIAILNSTQNMRLRGHVSHRRFVKREAVKSLARIDFTMAKYDVIGDCPLFNANNYDVKTNVKTKKYSWPNALYIARKARHQASSRLWRIFAYVINRVNKKQPRLIYRADYASGDKFRHSGTPPPLFLNT